MADPVARTAEPGAGLNDTHLVRPRGDNRRPLRGAIVTVAIVALAVLKPWSGPGDVSRATGLDAPSAGPDGVAAASPGPAATPTATPPGYDAPGGQCYPGTDWRLFAIEMNAGRTLRHWLSIEPSVAGTPGDPTVPFVRIVTDRVLALGFCVGSGPAGPGSLVEARAWALAPGGAAFPVALTPLVEYMPRQRSLGAVYRPPPASGGVSGAGWSPGRYVFAVRHGPAQGDERWFGVEVVVVTRVVSAAGDPSPAP